MKNNELVERKMRVKSGNHAPEKIYEVYDEADTNHCIMIYSGTSKKDAVIKAKKYAKDHNIPLSCIKAYELTKVDEKEKA